MAYIIVSISRVHQVYGFIGRFRPALLVFAFLVIYSFCVPSTLDKENLSKTWPPKALGLLFVCACLSAPFGISLGASARFILEEYSRELLLVAILIMSTRTVKDLRLFIWSYVLSCLFWVYLGLFQLDMSATATGLNRLDAIYTYDANDLGVVLSVGIALSLLMMTTSPRRMLKVVGIVTALGAAATVALTGSRGGFLGLGVLLLALLAIVNQVPVYKRLLVLASALGVLAAFAPPGYWQQMSTILEPSQDYNVTSPTGRVQILKRGLGYIADYPVFGVGINNFPRAEGTISELARNHIPGTPLRFNAPHNTFLQVTAEMGIPALFVWLSIMGYGTVGLRRLRSRMPASWKDEKYSDRAFLYAACTFIPVAYIGFAVTSFFVSFAYLAPFYILTSFAAATGFFVQRELSRPSGSEAELPMPPSRMRPGVIRPPRPRYVPATQMRVRCRVLPTIS